MATRTRAHLKVVLISTDGTIRKSQPTFQRGDLCQRYAQTCAESLAASLAAGKPVGIRTVIALDMTTGEELANWNIEETANRAALAHRHSIIAKARTGVRHG